MNIVDTYFAAMSDLGISKGQAIARLNKKMGRSYNHSRMAEFACGRRELPADVLRYMLRKSLRWAMYLSPDITTEENLVRALTPEPRK